MTLRLFANNSVTDIQPTEAHRDGAALMIGDKIVGDTLYSHAFDMRAAVSHIIPHSVINIADLLTIPYVWTSMSNVLPSDMIYTNTDTGEYIVLPCVALSNRDSDTHPSYFLYVSLHVTEFVEFINRHTESDVNLTLHLTSRPSGAMSSKVTLTLVRPDAGLSFNVHDGMSIRRVPTRGDLRGLLSVSAPNTTVSDVELMSGPIEATASTITAKVTTRTDSSGFELYTTKTITSDEFTPGTILPEASNLPVILIRIENESLLVTTTGIISNSDNPEELNDVYQNIVLGSSDLSISKLATLTTDVNGDVSITSEFPLSEITSMLNNAYISPSRVSVVRYGATLAEFPLAASSYVGTAIIRIRAGLIPSCFVLDNGAPLVYGTIVTDADANHRFIMAERPNSSNAYSPSDITDTLIGSPVSVTASGHVLTSSGIVVYNHRTFGLNRTVRLDSVIPGSELTAYAATEVNGIVHSIVSASNLFYLTRTDMTPQNKVSYDIVNIDGALSDLNGYSNYATLQLSATVTAGSSFPTFWSYDVSSGAPVLEYSASIVAAHRMIIVHVMRCSVDRFYVLGYVQSARGSLEVHVVDIWHTDKWNITQLYAKEFDVDNTKIVDYGKIVVADAMHICISIKGVAYIWHPESDVVKRLDNFDVRYADYQNGQLLLSGTRDGFGIIASDLSSEFELVTKSDAVTMQYFLQGVN